MRQGRKLLKSTDITRVSFFLSSASIWRKTGLPTTPLFNLSTYTYTWFYAFFSSKSTTYSIQDYVLCFVNIFNLFEYEPNKCTPKGSISCKTFSMYKKGVTPIVLKPNSWTYNFVEVSGHNLESSQTWGSCMDFLKHRDGSMVFYEVFLLSPLQKLWEVAWGLRK